MATAALTIPQAEQMYSGKELDPKLPINAPQGPHRVYFVPS